MAGRVCLTPPARASCVPGAAAAASPCPARGTPWAAQARPRPRPRAPARSVFRLAKPRWAASPPLASPSTGSSSLILPASAPRALRLCPLAPRAPRSSPACFLKWLFQAPPSWPEHVSSKSFERGADRTIFPVSPNSFENAAASAPGRPGRAQVPGPHPPGSELRGAQAASRGSQEKAASFALSFPGCPQVFFTPKPRDVIRTRVCAGHAAPPFPLTL